MVTVPPPPPPAWAPPPKSAPHGRTEGAGHDPHAGHTGHPEHSRLFLLIALSIAVVSVLGAVVGWRAEVHASTASQYDQDSVAANITAAQQRSDAEALAEKAAADYSHYQRLGAEAARIDPAGCNDTSPQSVPQREAESACSVQVVFSGYNDQAYITKNGTFNVSKYADDIEAANSLQADTEPEVYDAKAEQQRNDEDNLLYLSLGLVLALALLTLARLGTQRRTALLLAVPGWLCLLGGAALLGIWEL